MLHVFHVDGGRTVGLDVGLVTGSVGGLQAALEEATGVRAADQVLLVSGGTVLDANKQLKGYQGAGTESNPVFLASRVVSLEPGALPFAGDEAAEVRLHLKDLEAQVEAASTGVASFESLKRLSGLAKASAQNAERAFDVCKRLVEEQHLLHQGWSTLVANLEDVVGSCERRMAKLGEAATKFAANKDKREASELLSAFDADLDLLGQIPVPAALLSTKEARAQLSLASGSPSSGPLPASLLEWISAVDPSHALTELAVEARTHLEQVGRFDVSALSAVWERAKAQARQEDMAQIKGISKRLGQLDSYLRKAETVVSEQRQWADSVASTEAKATPRADPDLLAEIRQIQQESVKGMLAQQTQLAEIAGKFRDSKAELLDNVRRRIGTWIQETHGSLHEVLTRQMRQTAKLSSLRRRLELVRQIHEAPPIFAAATAEVLRRRSFASEFADWSAQLARKASSLRDSEAEIRAGFARKLERHFLRALFPTLAAAEAMPDFATVAPAPFDQGLLPLEVEDVQALREAAPSLRPYFQVSKTSVYECLAVVNPAQSQSTLRREPSFLSGTPPSGFLSSRSFPSSTWLSGDENLGGPQISPAGLLEAGPAPTEDPGGLTLAMPAPDVGEEGGSCRSAPIQIPSRPPSMSTSRQASEGHFGTPAEDFAPSSGEGGHSLPEIISKAELIGGLAKDLGSPSLIRSTPSPLVPRRTRHAASKSESEEDPLSNVAQLLLQASTGLAETQTSAEWAAPDQLRTAEERVLELEAAESQLSGRLADLESASKDRAAKLGDKEGAVSSSLRSLRSELAALQSELAAAVAAQSGGVAQLREGLEMAAAALEERLTEQRRQEEAAKQGLESTAAEAASTSASLEAVVAELQSAADARELEVAALQTRLAEQQAGADAKRDEATAEIRKQLIIESELSMEQLRKALRSELEERDADLARLQATLALKEEELRKVRVEQETLVASVYERTDSPSLSTSPPAGLEARLRHELEGEFRDKLSLLLRGAESKAEGGLERAEAEKRAELRLLAERKDSELAAKDDQIALLKAQLACIQGPTVEAAEECERKDSAVLVIEEPMAASMMASTMSLSVAPASDDADSSVPSPPGLTESGGGVSRETQTRVGPKEMGYLVAMADVREGDTVILTYSPSFKGFVLFTASSVTHFLKESSARRMELVKADGGPAVQWALARVSRKPDYCQIKKLDNRYGLPLETKFYRIDAEKLPTPPRGSGNGRSQIGSSLPQIQETSRE